LNSCTDKFNHRKAYNADGVVRFTSMFDLEVLLLETSGAFENKDERKISFDNIKGMYALLVMATTVADNFPFASVEWFEQLKLYYIQASGKEAMKIAKRSSILNFNIQMFIFVFGPYNTSPMAFIFTIVNIKLK
jgi:hypothetical protein